MSKTSTDARWHSYDDDGGLIYPGDGFKVRVAGSSWWVISNNGLLFQKVGLDFEKAKRQAERWILEREGLLSPGEDLSPSCGGLSDEAFLDECAIRVFTSLLQSDTYKPPGMPESGISQKERRAYWASDAFDWAESMLVERNRRRAERQKGSK